MAPYGKPRRFDDRLRREPIIPLDSNDVKTKWLGLDSNDVKTKWLGV